MQKLIDTVRSVQENISFTILEIGAANYENVNRREPFHQLVDFFPDTKIIGFEVEESVCQELNLKAKDGFIYYPFALGERSETRPFYETKWAACCSLYEPNEQFNELYNGLDVQNLTKKRSIQTINLNNFVNEYGIEKVDFIKIDVQGAELDVFKGGTNILSDVLAIVSEVEFVPLYIDQPLFGDVSGFLTDYNLMFHKFLTLQGTALKPFLINNDINASSQIMWSDAMFIRNVDQINNLNEDQLLKLSLLARIYGSPDLTLFCLATIDKRKGTKLVETFLNQ